MTALYRTKETVERHPHEKELITKDVMRLLDEEVGLENIYSTEHHLGYVAIELIDRRIYILSLKQEPITEQDLEILE